jgi:hypothetical protein
MKNNINPNQLNPQGPKALLSYLTDGSVLWVLVTLLIILVVAAKFFAPW